MTTVPDTPDPAAQAVGQATVLLRQAIDLLQAHLAVLTPDQRDKIPPVPDTFAAAANTALQGVGPSSALAAACKTFDPDQVRSDLELAESLSLVVVMANQLSLLVGDGHRVRLASAFTGILPWYGVAKEASRFDTSLREYILPLQEMFAERSKPRKTSAPAPAPAPAPAESEPSTS